MPDFDEVIGELRDAWNAGDMDGVRALLHADVVHTPPPGWPEPGPYVGREAVMTHFNQLREAFEAEEVDVTDVTPLGERVVLRLICRGSGLGPEAEIQMWQVSSVQDGLLFSLAQFWDQDEALEAARSPSPGRP